MSSLKDSSRPFTVIVEGNIGSGKTTFLQHFDQFDNVCVLAEPIHLWRNCDGHNLLSLLYQDIKKWSFTFQSYVQLTMLQYHTKKTPHPIKLMERSMFSARYCFVEQMKRDGVLSDASAAVIDRHFTWIKDNTNVDVDLIVYLRTTPQVVFERMMARNREEEKSVSFDYLKSLHDIHEDWLFHKTLFSTPAPVLILDANQDKATIHQEYLKSEQIILNRTVAVGS
ncbi:hypothetical protein ABEB36_014435 [Hypothenemus hampei]|uniref:Deoxynucleoside kinase domain-containing protein n=1 Tax=Hypothenemus hampei TaxID=57062 RepID=A0ABD1E2R6_HYPHA